MKTFGKLLTAGAVALAVASCSIEDSYGGFFELKIDNNNSPVYANTASSFIAFGSYGTWSLNVVSGSDWCTPMLTQGYGYAYYSIPVYYEENTTREQRLAYIRIEDVNNSDDVWTEFSLIQYATRGDGSFGGSPLAATITGDDGSSIVVEYDTLCRPLSLVIEKNGDELHNLSISYDASDSTITVNTGKSSLVGTYESGYQTESLISSTDTVEYYDQTMLIGTGSAFNVEYRKSGGEYSAQALLFTNGTIRNGAPDGTQQADSIRYLHHYSDDSEYREFMAITYSSDDNRCQSVDVNQLILGVEECNPYQLLGLFRDARNSYIISEATTDTGNITVSTTLNSDGSVNTMTVTNKDGSTVTYTFTYSTEA